MGVGVALLTLQRTNKFQKGNRHYQLSLNGNFQPNRTKLKRVPIGVGVELLNLQTGLRDQKFQKIFSEMKSALSSKWKF